CCAPSSGWHTVSRARRFHPYGPWESRQPMPGQRPLDIVKLRHLLLGLLVFAVLTVWVRERWALSVVEGAVFSVTCVVLIQTALARRRLTLSLAMLPVLFICLWAAVQQAAHWTAVRSDTAEACLYWLTAVCLVILGANIC